MASRRRRRSYICSFCGKAFWTNNEFRQHELNHDFFSCIHCIQLLQTKKSKLVSSYNTFNQLPTTKKPLSSLSPLSSVSPSSSASPSNYPYKSQINSNFNINHNKNDASSNNSNINIKNRKRKFNELKPPINYQKIDKQTVNANINNNSNKKAKTAKKRIDPSKILNLISENENDSSSLSSSFDITPKQSDDDDDDTDISSSSSSSSDDCDSSSDVIILTKDEDLNECKWNTLSYRSRNPINLKNESYFAIDCSILSSFISISRINTEISNKLFITSPSDRDIKLRKFLIEFIIKKIEILMTSQKYFRLLNLNDNNNINYSQYVHLYGSLATGIDSKGCDIDIAIKIPNNKISSKLFLKNFANLLSSSVTKNRKRFRILRIFRASVPILKISAPAPYQLDADISIYSNHDISVKYINSLLNYKNDIRIKQFVIAIKHWSKYRKINDSQTGKINSFGFTILALKYLQILKNPLIPVMKYRFKDNITSCNTNDDGFSKYYSSSLLYKKMEIYSLNHVNPSNNHQTLCELLYGFFEFYSNFNYKKYEISLNHKSLIFKQKNKYFNNKLKENQLIFIISDPIDTNNNCAKNVRYNTANLLINEFRRALIILLYNGSYYGDVCDNIQNSKQCNNIKELKYWINKYIEKNKNKNNKYHQFIKKYVIDSYIPSHIDHTSFNYNLLKQPKRKKRKFKHK